MASENEKKAAKEAEAAQVSEGDVEQMKQKLDCSTEEKINKRMLVSIYKTEPKIALLRMQLQKKELYGAPVEFAKSMEEINARYDEAVRMLIVETRYAAQRKAERDRARHEALALEMEQQKENAPPVAEPAGKPPKHSKRKAEGEPTTKKTKKKNKVLLGELETPEECKKRVAREFLELHSADEAREHLELTFYDETCVMLYVHKIGQPNHYDVYLLHPFTPEQLKELDAKLAKAASSSCTCKFDALYWRGVISKNKVAHRAFTPSTPAGDVVLAAEGDVRFATPLVRVLFWPSA